MVKRNIIVALISLSVGVAGVSFVGSAQVSADIKNNICGGADLTLSSGTCGTEKVCVKKNSEGACIEEAEKNEASLNKLITQIINVISAIVGVIAVIMIIFGGFKYITSGGDSGKISSAKTTIIYAIVGLIIVALAQAIVKFVLSKV